MKIYKLVYALLTVTFFSCSNDSDPCEGTQLPVTGTCTPVTPHGNLIHNPATGAFSYTTSGGGLITFDTTLKISHTTNTIFEYEVWGGYYDTMGIGQLSLVHENLNGKHIKDKIGVNRTIIFPDGAKITWSAESDTLKVLTFSIYDGVNSYRINSLCNNVLEYSGSDECITKLMDAQEPDGETGSFEISSEKVLIYNLYMEVTPGNKVEDRYDLGEIFFNNPNNVRDYFDDPRYLHT